MGEKVSEIFEEAFEFGGSGCRHDCICGRVHFDTFNQWDWAEGELENLVALSEENENYIPHDHSIGFMVIEGKDYVYDCPCNGAFKYEKFIRNHASQIAKYLNETAKELREKADRIEVKT